MLYVVFALVLGAIVYATLHSIRHLEEGTKTIEAMAREFGLIFDDGGLLKRPTLKGIFRGVSLNVYEESRYAPLQKNRQTYTLYRVHLTHIDVPAGLSLHSENLSSKIGKLFGGQDIQLDDPELDKTFIIRGESSDDVRAFLSRPNVKEHLLKIHQLGGDFKLENNTLCLEFYDSIIGQHRVLRPRLGLLASCVHAMAQGDSQKIAPNQPVPFMLSNLPKNPPPIPEAPNHLDNIGDSW